MKFTSQDSNPLIGEGEHQATIARAYMSDDSSTGETQLAVLFKVGLKQITRWFNLKGFKVDPDEPKTTDAKGREIPNYLLTKNGKRIEDKEKTKSCMRIVGQLGHDIGIEVGEEFDLEDLVGAEIGINVVKETSDFASSGSRLRVSYTLPADKVKAPAEGEKAEVFT